MYWRIAAASTGMVLLALCSHQGGVWAIAAAGGLILTGTAIAWEGQGSGASPTELLGLGHPSTRTFAWTLLGVGIGAGGGFAHRHGLDLPLLPAAGVQPFVIVACLIGAAEELLYRGWLLGQARALGWPVAVAIAALAHAAYKTALFAWAAASAGVDLRELFWLTAAAGLALGALRAWSGSVLPALLAHVVFDFVVYRAVAQAPWWVWG